MLQRLINKTRWLISKWKEATAQMSYTPTYRLEEIIRDKEEQYTVLVRVVNKHFTFKMKPEEILAEDKLVDQFSPRDIRTLTYLGYLGINAPKYKILAKRLSHENDKIIFALKKKGENKVIVKTADQILNEREILSSLNAEDAKTIGYTVGTESIYNEKRHQEILLKKKVKI
jgi:hypothetical protein